ncbi:D-alanyl-D-alanine carboxypeptidase [Kibdelosporangium aridum]|uniref:D-alanyl-D-alanine carboxypeptidase n=1 Tax=Kibdelosporangium aridum TaxID=2030 RepID=A0A1Y5XQ05_KIBAR|nr:D-alanyl-D-alanine carboxypeptidase [Kibdelosporangium aridum]
MVDWPATPARIMLTSMISCRFTRCGRQIAIVAVTSALLTAGTLAAPGATAASGGELDRQALQQSLEAVREAGMYGIYSSVRNGDRTWRGASGVADIDTGRPVQPDMVHRIGSVSKTFTAVAVLQQVQRGAIELDAPVGRYLPELVPGERGQKITVRMLLNHTSHIAEYLAKVFPSVPEGSLTSLDDNRFRAFTTEELARLGLDGAATGEPGTVPGSHSNTNYVLAGLLLEKVTGEDAERYITREVIHRAGLRHTSFPRTPHLPGPHSKAYTSLFGLVDPPRDYSVYNMSWASTAGAIMSTMDDLNRFFRALLRGELIGAAQLAEMQKTVTMQVGQDKADYGLGIYAFDLPCGRFWGHNGRVFGMGTRSVSSRDGHRQLSFGVNSTWYQRLDENGNVEPSPIDFALVKHEVLALCGPGAATANAT